MPGMSSPSSPNFESLLPMASITVIKLDALGQETVRYYGKVLRRGDSYVLLEAHFNRPDHPLGEIVLRPADRFVEVYYSDRWYNIFALHDRQDDHLKGWYCNVGRPADIRAETVSYVDLALDLLVYPDGRQEVLDEDEFSALRLSRAERRRAWAALRELQALFAPPVTAARLASANLIP